MRGGVLGVLGSGRREGTTAALVAEALAGAAAGPAAVQRLGELSFRGCLGCGACRSGAPTCVLEDDLRPVLAATAAASALVLGTPIYYGYASGLCKSYLDRWYAFRDGARALRVPACRPALLLVTQGHPDPHCYAGAVESLGKILGAYGFVPRTLVAPGLDGPDAVARRPDLRAEARRLGATLAAGG